jgi:hypothetical protein
MSTRNEGHVTYKSAIHDELGAEARHRHLSVAGALDQLATTTSSQRSRLVDAPDRSRPSAPLPRGHPTHKPNGGNLTGRVNGWKHIVNALTIHYGDRLLPLTITPGYA